MTGRMINMNKIKRIICIMLSLAMLFLCACSDSGSDNSEDDVQTVKYSVPASSAKKSETVYVNLDNSGAQKSIKVSDWIHVPQGGVYVDDVTNLTDRKSVV